MVSQVQSIVYIVYNMKSLENDFEARTFDNDKSAPQVTSFQIESECTIS